MLYIFDKDGTLVSGPNGQHARNPDEQQLLPGVEEKIQSLKKEGHKIAIASNQGGVAWGYMYLNHTTRMLEDVAAKLGGVDAWQFCPYHPGAKKLRPKSRFSRNSQFRKPNPGMLIRLMIALQFFPAQTIMIGDMETDKQAAVNAGCRFEWAKDFFGWK